MYICNNKFTIGLPFESSESARVSVTHVVSLQHWRMKLIDLPIKRIWGKPLEPLIIIRKKKSIPYLQVGEEWKREPFLYVKCIWCATHVQVKPKDQRPQKTHCMDPPILPIINCYYNN